MTTMALNVTTRHVATPIMAAALNHPPKLDGFRRLVDDLSAVVNSSKGTRLVDIDHHQLAHLMRRYDSREHQWSQYALTDLSRAYTRNLIGAGSSKHNLLILAWNPGRGSAIHDHANAHCVMKVLKGRLEEVRYRWPTQSTVGSPMTVTRNTQLGVNDVTYMSDTLGLHKIRNPDPRQIAISLHLYTPPNAAKHGCTTFDEETGHSSHADNCRFFSVDCQRCTN